MPAGLRESVRSLHLVLTSASVAWRESDLDSRPADRLKVPATTGSLLDSPYCLYNDVEQIYGRGSGKPHVRQ